MLYEVITLGPSFENSKKPLKKLLKANSEQDYSDGVSEFWEMNLRNNFV